MEFCHCQRLARCRRLPGVDVAEEHNRLRREIFAKICQDIARVQFQEDG
jgi:hypothetical protein